MSDVVAIKDSNVVIDLVEAGLFRAWFSLGIRTVTTDFVVRELEAGSQWTQVHPMIVGGLLEVEEFSPTETIEAVKLSRSYGVSVTDASVLHLSATLKAYMLTGDKRLRNSSKKHGVEVKGVLWVLDLLVERQVIPKSQALAGLRLLQSAGGRLPLVEIEKRLENWSES